MIVHIEKCWKNPKIIPLTPSGPPEMIFLHRRGDLIFWPKYDQKLSLLFFFQNCTIWKVFALPMHNWCPKVQKNKYFWEIIPATIIQAGKLDKKLHESAKIWNIYIFFFNFLRYLNFFTFSNLFYIYQIVIFSTCTRNILHIYLWWLPF